MDTRSRRGSLRTVFAFAVLSAISAFPLIAGAADKASPQVKERIPDVAAPAPAPASAQTAPAGATVVGRAACAVCHAEQSEAFDKTVPCFPAGKLEQIQQIG